MQRVGSPIHSFRHVDVPLRGRAAAMSDQTLRLVRCEAFSVLAFTIHDPNLACMDPAWTLGLSDNPDVLGPP